MKYHESSKHVIDLAIDTEEKSIVIKAHVVLRPLFSVSFQLSQSKKHYHFIMHYAFYQNLIISNRFTLYMCTHTQT